ncbi:hypothetical protein, partial [Salmonella enterica]|uniref:hypothetical protein n=1 Tax=Salmonella enterica TaxID=28901 RepID=UPI00398C74CF
LGRAVDLCGDCHLIQLFRDTANGDIRYVAGLFSIRYADDIRAIHRASYAAAPYASNVYFPVCSLCPVLHPGAHGR